MLSILIGYACEKTGYLTDIRQRVNLVIIRVTLPALVISTLSSQELNAQLAISATFVAVCAAVVIILLFNTGKLYNLDKDRKTVHCCISGFGNVIFLGFPIADALFGTEGLFFASIFAIVNDTYVFTLGIYTLSNGGKDSLKKLLNPNTISFVIAIAMLCLGVQFPAPVHSTIVMFGNATFPLSMMFIGATLAMVDIKNIKVPWAMFAAFAVKMLITPLILLTVFVSTKEFLPVIDIAMAVVVLQMAMPTQTMIAVLIDQYGGDQQYAALCIFVSHILALATFPLVYYLVNMFLLQ